MTNKEFDELKIEESVVSLSGVSYIVKDKKIDEEGCQMVCILFDGKLEWLFACSPSTIRANKVVDANTIKNSAEEINGFKEKKTPNILRFRTYS